MNDISILTKALQHSGLRLTPQRMAICELLAATDRHPTALWIYEQLRPRYPSLSLATVYHTLEALVGLGAINELGSAGDGTVHYDANVQPHINLACVSCHRVIDLPSEHIEHVASEVKDASGYRLFGARILYYGLCPECQAKAI
ncbi:MAG: transcriptional repressor [Chloroflexi bacterium]|nr:transcriptional repressor [Chloroflexota bacterium]